MAEKPEEMKAEKPVEVKKEPQPKEKEVVQKPVKPVSAPKKAVAETYPVSEIIANYKAFNASKPIVITAMKLAGVKQVTVEEAKKIIETFKNKEVK